MKVVLLAGGRGSRMGSETNMLPKPMVTIGGIPIIHHIMNWYFKFGYNDFIILAGYKWEEFSRYFDSVKTNFTISILDTGLDTPTAERLLYAEDQLEGRPFMLTYGDGLSNIHLSTIEKKIYSNHAIITAVHPPGRFGTLTFNTYDGARVAKFDEKQRFEDKWINGGFMGFNPFIFNYIEKGDMLEFDVLPRLADEGLLYAHFHNGFWQCMDTPRDREYLEGIWKLKRCYWRT